MLIHDRWCSITSQQKISNPGRCLILSWDHFLLAGMTAHEPSSEVDKCLGREWHTLLLPPHQTTNVTHSEWAKSAFLVKKFFFKILLLQCLLIIHSKTPGIKHSSSRSWFPLYLSLVFIPLFLTAFTRSTEWHQNV